MEKDKKHSYIVLNIATLLIAATPLFAKFLSMPASVIIFFRCMFAAVSLFLFISYFKLDLLLKKLKDYIQLFFLGSLLAVHWVTYFFSVKISSVAVAMISLFTFPLITALLEPYFFRKRLEFSDTISAFLVLLGIFFVIPEFTFSNNTTLGVFFGIVSAVAYSIRNIMSRKCVQEYKSSVVMFYQVFFGFLVLLPVLFTKNFIVTGYNLVVLLILGVLFTAVSHTLLVSSLVTLRARTVGVFTSLQPIYGILFAMFLIHEVPSLKTLTGGILITVAVFLEMTTGDT